VPPRIGLVLGAGGLTGQAFHAGVLAGIQDATGWDARDADVVVGTSAGAAVGAYLRFGLSPPDLVAMLTDGEASPAGRALLDRLGPAGDWTAPTVPRTWSPPHPRLLRRMVRTPWKVRPEALLGVSVPTGRIEPESWTSALRPVTGPDWPERPLWICAVRMDDAHRVVFGRPGAPTTDVATAVGASAAIPGYFAPVTIHGRRYVDGGVHTPTNADILRRESLDLVIVSSPMSRSRGTSLRPAHAPRGHFRARLGQEVRRLRRAGIAVRTFQPADDDLDAMGNRAMEHARVADVVATVRATTRRRLADQPLPDL
jgi:NTE family protein